MNKRPLLLLFVCFVLGEAGAYVQTQWSIGITAVGAVVLAFWYGYTNGIRPLLLWCFLLYFAGLVLCRQSLQPSALELVCGEEERQMCVSGQVDCIEEGAYGYRIHLQQVLYLQNGEWRATEKGVLVRTGSTQPPNCRLGQTIRCEGTVYVLSGARNPGGFDSYRYYQGRGIDCGLRLASLTVTNQKNWPVRDRLRLLRQAMAKRLQELAPPEPAGFLEAIVLGEKKDLDSGIKKQYQQSGIAHLIAISGLHIGFFGMLVYGILQNMAVPNGVAGLCTAALLTLYAVLAGMPASCERAVIMFLAGLLAKALGRSYDLLSALSLAGLLILSGAPLLFLDAGFLLSFGAIVGIGAVSPIVHACCFTRFRRRIHKKSRLQRSLCKLLDNVLTSLSVEVVTVPVIAYFYCEIPPYSVFLNLIVIPLMSVMLPSAVLGLLASYVFKKLGQILLAPAVVVLQCNDWLSGWFCKLPYSRFVTGCPEWWELVLYILIVVAGLSVLWALPFLWSLPKERCAATEKAKVRKRIRVRLGIFLLVCLLTVGAAVGNGKRRVLRFAMLDVGQGDGMVLELPDGKVILVDGGSSTESELYKNVYEPFLKTRGITRVDYAIISHSDTDHLSGVRELLQNAFPIGTLVLPDLSEPDEAYQEMCGLAQRNETQVVRLSRGQLVESKQWSMECLHPCVGATGADANADSLTILLRYHAFSMLLTGDLQGEGEEQVLQYIRERGWNSCTVLKVAHHGSKNSTKTEFLQQMTPKYAIISAGRGNFYGHPHAALLERLDAQGIPTFCTKKSGAILLETDGYQLHLTEYALRRRVMTGD